MHWGHCHYGPLPAPLTQSAPAASSEALPTAPVVESSKSSNSYSKEPETTEPETDAAPEYTLAASKEGLGELYPVLKDKFGNIIDGFHRKGENANWREETLPWIDTPEKLEAARLAVNYARRRMAPEEIKERITYLVGKAKMSTEQIAKLTGIAERTIRKYMPQEFKNQYFVELRQSAVARMPRIVNLTEQETLTSNNGTGFEPVSTPHAPSPITGTIQPDFSSPEIPKIEEPFPEGTPICPICAVSMDPTEYEEVKQAVAVKYGQQIQTLLFPTAEKKKGGKM